MKEHGVDKQHLAWISKLRTTQLTNEACTLRVEKNQNNQGAPTWSARKLMVFTELVDTVLAALNKKWRRKGKDFGFRLDEWYFPSVAYADDIVVKATSQKALEQKIQDLTEGFREIGLEIGHAKTK